MIIFSLLDFIVILYLDQKYLCDCCYLFVLSGAFYVLSNVLLCYFFIYLSSHDDLFTFIFIYPFPYFFYVHLHYSTFPYHLYLIFPYLYLYFLFIFPFLFPSCFAFFSLHKHYTKFD
mgnify:CR=1 FL=1